MKIIVQMDPIEKLNLSGDSTFALLNEAQNRGYKVDFYSPDMLTLDNNILYADAYEILVSTDPDEIKKISPAKELLNNFSKEYNNNMEKLLKGISFVYDTMLLSC